MEDNIKTDLEVTYLEIIECIHLAQSWDYWRALLKKVMKIGFHKILGISSQSEPLLSSPEGLNFKQLISYMLQIK
jgi:hypothetical protein